MTADPQVLGMVLAGGAGKRLAPLTADRAKPAVPFGGLYRLIDFALSNLVNAGMRRICVLTQYKSHSLDRHITTTWRLSQPARQLRDAGARAAAPRPALVHRLRRRDLPVAEPDLRRPARHRRGVRRGSRLPDGPAADDRSSTSSTGRASRSRRSRCRARRRTAFGVIQAAADGRTIEAFLEKPADPPGMPGQPDLAFASMGIYVFTHRRARGRAAQGRGRRRQPARHGRRHRADAGRRTARRRSTTSWTTRCPARRTATPATGATSGRWTPTSRRTWTCAPCTRSSTCTTPGGRSSRTSRRSRRPSSCTTAATGSAGRSTAWSATA